MMRISQTARALFLSQGGRRRLRGTLAALIGAGALLAHPLFASAIASGPAAGAARTITIAESASLHLTSHTGFTLNEKGQATGTIPCTIYIHLHVVSTNRVTAEVNLYPRGSSLTGYATADYRTAGATATFSGTMSISRGTGSYRNARGHGLAFSGTVRRANDAVTVHLSGRISN